MDKNQKKVSILTPCYNGANYINRLLESVLMQTYSNMEMFVINDGSTDNTEDIVNSYIPKFLEKGISLQCINQTNQAQAAAINNGLKLISGDYLVWPDSDDYYDSAEAIAKMASVLDENNQYSMVRTFANVLDEDTLQKIGEFGGKRFSENRITHLFEDCMLGNNNFWFGAGIYMLRTDLLFDNYPDKNIYTSSKYGGQNWQLMLPMLYKKECYTIEEFLYNVLSRDDSHSRGTFKSSEELIKRNEELRNVLINTLDGIKNMPEVERENYKSEVHAKYELIIIHLLAKSNKKEAISRVFQLRKSDIKHLTLKDHLRFLYYMGFK